MAQPLAKYADDLKIDIKHLQQAHDIVGASEKIIILLEELYKLRNKNLYYLVFEIEMFWGTNRYSIEFQEENLTRYTALVDNFNKISFRGSLEATGGRTIRSIKIITRRVVDGPPSLGYHQEYKTPDSSDIKFLESITASPSYLFQKENSTILDTINDNGRKIGDFLANEEDIQSLIGFKISLSKKNYLSYMRKGFVLEAGRGKKWMLISSDSFNDEFLSLFARNNIILESDSDEDSESSSDE